MSKIFKVNLGEYYLCKKQLNPIIVKGNMFKVSRILRNKVSRDGDAIFLGDYTKNYLFIRIAYFKEFFYTGKHLLIEKKLINVGINEVSI